MTDYLRKELEQTRVKHDECINNGYYDLALKYVELEKELLTIIERIEHGED